MRMTTIIWIAYLGGRRADKSGLAQGNHKGLPVPYDGATLAAHSNED
jgi:hypothetical protein